MKSKNIQNLVTLFTEKTWNKIFETASHSDSKSNTNSENKYNTVNPGLMGQGEFLPDHLNFKDFFINKKNKSYIITHYFLF